MHFERHITLDVPRQVVWNFLWDMPRLAACVPGCDGVETLAPYQRYQAIVHDRVGPFKVKVPLQIDILTVTPPTRLVAQAGGRDAAVQSLVKVAVDLTLHDTSPTATLLHLAAEVTVLGKLGTLGHSMIVRRGDAIIEQFTSAMQTALSHKES